MTSAVVVVAVAAAWGRPDRGAEDDELGRPYQPRQEAAEGPGGPPCPGLHLDAVHGREAEDH